MKNLFLYQNKRTIFEQEEINTDILGFTSQNPEKIADYK